MGGYLALPPSSWVSHFHALHSCTTEATEDIYPYHRSAKPPVAPASFTPRRLIRALVDVPRAALQLLPFYARVVAVLAQAFPDVPAGGRVS